MPEEEETPGVHSDIRQAVGWILEEYDTSVIDTQKMEGNKVLRHLKRMDSSHRRRRSSYDQNM